MAFIRMSLMTPRSGQEEELADLLNQLVQSFYGKPGFIAAYRNSAGPHSKISELAGSRSGKARMTPIVCRSISMIWT
jgi:hypothetical protein